MGKMYGKEHFAKYGLKFNRSLKEDCARLLKLLTKLSDEDIEEQLEMDPGKMPFSTELLIRIVDDIYYGGVLDGMNVQLKEEIARMDKNKVI